MEAGRWEGYMLLANSERVRRYFACVQQHPVPGALPCGGVGFWISEAVVGRRFVPPLFDAGADPGPGKFEDKMAALRPAVSQVRS